MVGPRRSVQGLLPPKSPPPFARGPSPAATAAKPIPPPPDTRLPPTPIRRSYGVRPPAVPTAPMRAPAASTGGTSENLQQIPCHPVPHLSPKTRPASSIPPKVSRHRRCLRRWTGCRFGSTRTFPEHALKNRFSRPSRCRLRRTLRTPGGPPNSLNSYQRGHTAVRVRFMPRHFITSSPS